MILPFCKARAGSSIITVHNRGFFTICEYAKWPNHSKNTYIFNYFLQDLPTSENWHVQNNPLFLYCSDMLHLIAPEQWIDKVVGAMGEKYDGEVAREPAIGGGITG